MVSRSLSVTELSRTVSKSTVIPSGVPSSSFRAYRLPIDALDESTLLAMPKKRRRAESRETKGVNWGWAESGMMRTLFGATARGRDKTCYVFVRFCAVGKGLDGLAYRSRGIVGSMPVDVFEETVQDSANAE